MGGGQGKWVLAFALGTQPFALELAGRVDDCEEHASEAFNVNAIGALNVARVCAAANALCVYISTDYVFDGAKEGFYTQADEPRPLSVSTPGASRVRALIPVVITTVYADSSVPSLQSR